jgi:hypothetical protein
MFVLIAFELVSHPEQRPENGGAIVAITHRLRSAMSTAQSDTGLVAVDEFNARRFERAPNSSQIIDRRDPPAFFKVADSALAQVGSSSQYRL